MITLQDRYRGCLVGLACGDAVGTTFEFSDRGTFTATDMVGGGPFNLKAGQYTDDTSMALCLAQSLIDCNDFSPYDQMMKYCDWYKNGYMSSTGTCFDIGMTTSRALHAFLQSDNVNPFCGSTHDTSSGNGSIMRLAPVVMWLYQSPIRHSMNIIEDSSRTTHGSEKCINACKMMTQVMYGILDNLDKNAISGVLQRMHEKQLGFMPQINPVGKAIDQISGSGYVVESLEAALWCFFNTDSYEDAVLAAVNLGDDTDTTAAVVGQIAGAYYGYSGITKKWCTKLQDHDMILNMSDKLYEMRINSTS